MEFIMNEIVFSRTSFGYRYLCFLNSDYRHRPPTDICAFGRALFWRTLVLFFWVSLGFVITSGLGGTCIMENGAAWFLSPAQFKAMPAWLQIIIAFPTGIVILAALILALFAIAGVCWVADKVFQYFKDLFSNGDSEVPGPITSAYKAFKDKTCYKIKFD
jgi:hypothetical protein